MKNHPHSRAVRNSSSVKPFTRPVATSSIRRMPSAMAAVRLSGATALSTNPRARSSRSSGGNSKAILVTLLATMPCLRTGSTSWQATGRDSSFRPQLNFPSRWPTTRGAPRGTERLWGGNPSPGANLSVTIEQRLGLARALCASLFQHLHFGFALLLHRVLCFLEHRDSGIRLGRLCRQHTVEQGCRPI